ncbi:hypothetical protein RB595_008014 [Gaeumannomyces hyphopodioides]
MDLQRELARLALQRLQSSQNVRTCIGEEAYSDGAEGSPTQSQHLYRTPPHGARGRRKSVPAIAIDDGQDVSDAESDSSMCLERPPPGRDESPDGYEMRSRYWEAMGVLNRSMAQSDPALYVCDSVCLPPPGLARTDAVRDLGALSIRRAWRRRRPGYQPPDLGSVAVVEAIMTYERGAVVADSGRVCARCLRGEGPSPDCVILDRAGGGTGPCSNCIYDRAAPLCDAGRAVMLPPPLPLPPPSPPLPTAAPRAGGGGGDGRSYSPETRIISAELSGKATKEDLEAVWKVIAEVIERRPRVIEEGTTAAAADQLLRVEGHSDRGRSPAARARMVEDAALLVVRAADEWGHIVKERGPVSSTAAEKDVPGLVERSKRIKGAAAKVARAAGGLAERMEAASPILKNCV